MKAVFSNFVAHSELLYEMFMDLWYKAIHHSLRLNELRVKQILEKLQQTMELSVKEHGLEMKVPSKLVGKSGILHDFDFVLKKSNEPNWTIVGDYLAKETDAKNKLVSLFLKSIDLESCRKFLVVPSSNWLGKSDSELAKNYDITVVSGATAEEIISKIVKKMPLLHAVDVSKYLWKKY
ncbi:hypothetical protein KEJ18_04975 [Candidatus Bathyarchaeota archaeon]|nr:hypothetical protein [Candidatus Bathyarchaeota archaeon]